MAASTHSSGDEPITDINITPMVDVMLVLLVIFMLAAPTLYQSGIKVELPVAKNGENVDKITLKFTLHKDGRILLDKKEVKKEELPGLLKKAVEISKSTDAVIAADKSLNYGSVVELIDQIKSAGIQKFAVAVDGPLASP
jgi:biopolymer transport protein ExbD